MVRSTISENSAKSWKRAACRFAATPIRRFCWREFSVWGLEEMLARANGMFAFAVWDRVERP